MRFAGPTWVLWRRELVRFGRDRGRWVGALLTPAVMWVLLGFGMRQEQYFFSGTLVLVVLFSAIFSTFSVIEDRREGFLQGVLVSPAARGAIVAGKTLGGATTALIPAGIFLLLVPLAGMRPGWQAGLAAMGVLALIAFGQTAFGFCFAWTIDSTQGFHGIMNLLLLPMWVLSGALFPVSGAPPWLQWVMRVNPLTYGVAAVREALHEGNVASLPAFHVSVGVSAAFAAASFGVAAWLTRRGE